MKRLMLPDKRPLDLVEGPSGDHGRSLLGRSGRQILDDELVEDLPVHELAGLHAWRSTSSHWFSPISMKRKSTRNR